MKMLMLLVCSLAGCWENNSYGCEWTRARYSQVQPVSFFVPQPQYPVVVWSYVQQNVVSYMPIVVYQPVVNTQVIAVPVATYPIYTTVPVVPYYSQGYTVYRY